MNEETVAALLRFKEEYRWRWGIIHKVLQRFYDAQITIPELKKLYRRYSLRTPLLEEDAARLSSSRSLPPPETARDRP